MLIDLRDILIIVTWKEIFVSILVGYFVSYNYDKIQESIEIKLNNDQKQVKITRFLTFVTAFSVITKHCKNLWSNQFRELRNFSWFDFHQFHVSVPFLYPLKRSEN